MNSGTPPRGPKLRIVCVNDVYTLEHLPRLRTLTRHYAASDPADVSITTIAGDFVGPSMLSSLDKGRGMIDCLNAVPITHVIFGNHEDDIPIDELRSRVREFRGTWLNTNMVGFEPALPTHQVLEIAAPGGRSVRVGLLGVVMGDATVYRHTPFGGASIEPANPAALRETERLVHDEHCVCVIPITHQTVAGDRDLALSQGAPRFPVIVGGHEHEVFIERLAGTWIVKAGADAVHAAIVDLVWPAIAPGDGAPDLPAVSARLEAVADHDEDATLRARVDAHMAAVHDLENATLVPLAAGEELSSVGTRARQTSLGTLLSSRARDALGADGCLFNGGGIRASREYRQRFTYGDLKAELPFDNEVVVVRLPGRVLCDAVAFSRARAPAESGGFLQVDDGITVDGQHRVTHIAGAPLDDARDYRIAMLRNLLLGMDCNEPLMEFALAYPDRVPPQDSGRDIRFVVLDSLAVALWKQLGAFDAIDTNHDGSISAPEIAAAVTRLTAEPTSKITIELLTTAADFDRDGVVSRDEIQALGDPARLAEIGEPEKH